MEFLKEIARELKIKSKADFARALEKSLQAYYSLEHSNDRLMLRDIVLLRRLPGMTDKKLLDHLEKEAIRQGKVTKHPAPQRSQTK